MDEKQPNLVIVIERRISQLEDLLLVCHEKREWFIRSILKTNESILEILLDKKASKPVAKRRTRYFFH